MPPDGDLIFLHRLQQRGLRFRRRAVDFVGQNDVGEDRPLQKPQLPRAGELVFLNDLGAGDVGRHQVGRELNAPEFERQSVGQRADQQRLGQARHAHQQAMPAGEHRHQQFLDHLLLPDDHAAQLLGDQPVRLVQFRNRLQVVVIRHVPGLSLEEKEPRQPRPPRPGDFEAKEYFTTRGDGE